MGIIDRVRALNFPLGECIVIGSGLLDAWGLREAHDIDLIVTPEFFAQLEATGEYKSGMKHDDYDFDFFKQNAVTVDSIRFVDPEFLIARKRERGTQKDLNDIQLLEQYLHGK